MTVETSTYVDPQERFRIVVPAGWDVRPNERGAAVALLEPERPEMDFRTNLNVVVQPREELGTLAELVDSSIARLFLHLTDFILIERIPEPERASERVVGTYRYGLYSLTIEQWYFLGEDVYFVVTATTTSDEYPFRSDGLREVADTFEVIA